MIASDVASEDRTVTHVGSNTRRRDGALFLSGRALYIDDLRLPGTVHAAIVRSPHAHARIVSIDLDAVRSTPGVLLALDGQAVREHMEPVPHFIDPAVFGGKSADFNCLATGKVIYAGQPVAVVVAATRADAEAAAELAVVEYEPLAAVMNGDAALLEDAPLVYDHWGDNLVLSGEFLEGDFAVAVQEADHVLEDEMHIQRYTSAPMETRGYVADWDADRRYLTFHGSCQNPHPLRWVLAKALRLTESDIRVITPRIGGAFGLKMHGHAEEALVGLLSMLLQRPVKWIEDRSECFLVAGREQVHRYAVAFDDDGTIVGFRDRMVANIGALSATNGWGMAFLTALTFPTGYQVKHCDVGFKIVATNKSPWNAARGYGKEATNLVMERAVDRVAQALGADPAEVRRRNLIRADQFPFATASGLNIDSGDYHALLDKALDQLDYPGARELQARGREQGLYLGIGIAFELTPESGDIPGTLVSGYDTSTVRMAPSGRVSILTGVTTPGGGNDTGIAQVVADELGVSMEQIDVVQGDTELCPYGFGNYSGRSMVVGGSSAALAARDVAHQLRTVAGAMLQVDPDSLELRGGGVVERDAPRRRLPVEDVAYAVYTDGFTTAQGIEPRLESTRTYKPENIRHEPDAKGNIQPYPTYSNAVHTAFVEVDEGTGKVTIRRFVVAHDCGTMINPMLVEGQMRGAVAMGIGAAMLEEITYESDGSVAVDRFKRYLMPRATDLPRIEMVHQVTPSPFTLLGAKGAGEAGVGGAQAALVNAVADALSPLGVSLQRMPISPPNVLAAILRAREARA